MQIREDVLRAAFVTGLYYHPCNLKELAEKVRTNKMLGSIESLAGDCFANIYNNILRYPPDTYDYMARHFFNMPVIDKWHP